MLGNLIRRYRVPMAVYTLLAAVIVALQHLSNAVTRDPAYTFSKWQGLRYYLAGLSQFDGPEYGKIAELGYSYTAGERSLIVWFPLYPMAIRWLTRLTDDYVVAGVLITLVGGFVAFIVYWQWLTIQGIVARARVISLLVLALYPYSFFLYGVVYSDALFLAAVISAFLLVDRKHFVWGGLVGILATATRSNGTAMIPALLVLAMQRDGVLSLPVDAKGLVARFALPIHFDRSKLRARAFAPLLSLIGVGSYMLYLWVQFGSPIIFATNERTYHPGGRPVFKVAALVRWYHFSDNPTYALTIALQGLVLLGVICLIPRVARRFGFAYALFLAIVVAIPTISTEDFMGTGRYLIVAFPAAAVVGEWLSDREERGRVWLAISGLAMLGMGMGFSRSWYLS